MPADSLRALRAHAVARSLRPAPGFADAIVRLGFVQLELGAELARLCDFLGIASFELRAASR